MQRSRCRALDGAAIIDRIRPELRHGIRLDTVDEIDSTNDALLRLPAREVHGRAVLAERQTAGRGRRGRRWESPAGNVCLSVGWHFDAAASDLGALGLAAGVCVCRALARIGLRGHGVKWPNDIQVGGEKLGGILVELRSGRSGCDAVIGIGINVRLDTEAAGIGQPVTDLASQPGVETADRNAVVAAVLEELISGLAEVEAGLGSFLQSGWPEWDLLKGHQVRVEREDGAYLGRAQGIAPDGALRTLVTAVNEKPVARKPMIFHSGEVSVRRA